MTKSKKDLYVGMKFNMLTVITDFIPSGGIRRAKVRCDCGAVKEVNIKDMKKKHGTKSCGCLQSSLGGLYGHPKRETWRNMVQRCTNSTNSSYPNYGGRGITVCEQWATTPHEFLKWCDQQGSISSKQLDRVDNSAGYSPDNCRFVSRSVNCRNRRSSRSVIGTSIEDGIQYFFTNMIESNDSGFNHRAVYNCCSGRAKTHRGFTWRYA